MKRIRVKVITGAAKEQVIKMADGTYKIKVSTPPEKGRANKRIIEVFSKELGVKRSLLRIISGEKSNNKVIEKL